MRSTLQAASFVEGNTLLNSFCSLESKTHCFFTVPGCPSYGIRELKVEKQILEAGGSTLR